MPTPIYDNDFQSFAINDIPPYGSLYTSGASDPQIKADITGIFGDTKSVFTSTAAGLIFPTQTPGDFDPFYQDLTIFQGLFINQATNEQVTLYQFLNSHYPSYQVALTNLMILADGTIAFMQDPASPVAQAVSDFSLLSGKWYWISCKIHFGISGGKLS